MTNKSKKILSEISAGELLDKISILEIKLDKIKDESNQKEITKEQRKIIQAQMCPPTHEHIVNNSVLKGDTFFLMIKLSSNGLASFVFRRFTARRGVLS